MPQVVTLGEFNGLLLRDHDEERLIVRSGRFLLFVHLYSEDFPAFQPVAFEIIKGIKTKTANQTVELTAASPSCFHASGIKHPPASVPVSPGGFSHLSVLQENEG
jgi:hypothetical protein